MIGRGVSGLPAPAPHEIPRERLLEILHGHAERPLLLLVAPAGFGKSTLVASYGRGSGAIAAWVTLHAGDRDSRSFFSRLGDALEGAFDDDGLLPELRRGLVEGAEGIGLARLLAADLAEAPSGFILVLDDFHTVHDSGEVVQAVDALVRLLPEGGQVVITAREPPPLSMTRLVANESVFGLGAEDLRFTDEETADLRRAIGGDPTHDAAAEGWVAGILLGGAPRQLGVAGGTLLGSYVEREVLARLRDTEQRWLETLAVLETITPRAAERLLGRGAWVPRLERLAERCPFLVAGEDGGYRLHALIRGILLNRLRRGPAGRATRVWKAARRLAEEAYDTVGVVRACQELGEGDEAVALVHRTVDEAMRTGRWAAALATLDLLPEVVRRAQPLLTLVEAHALVQTGRPELARQAAEVVLQHAGRTGDVEVQVRAVLELANVARYAGDVDAALDWLSAADHLLRGASLEPARRRLLEGRALGLRGVCQAVKGRSAEARDSLESAVRLLAQLGPSRELAVVQTNVGTLCSRLGDYESAQAALTDATSYWRLVGDRVTLATAQATLGFLHLQAGSLERAGSVLASAVEVARAVGAQRIEAHATVSLAQWHRLNGRLADAVATLDEGLRMAEEVAERELLVTALRLRAEVAIVQNDLVLARNLLAQAQAEGQRLGADFQMASVERTLGRLHLAEGAGQTALVHLDAALQRGASVWSPGERLEALYWTGATHLMLGRAREAEEALRSALACGETTGATDMLAGPVAEDDRLLRHGLAAGVDPFTLGRIERLAAARRPWTGVPRPAQLAVVARNDLPRLEVRLFGGFTLYRDGQVLDAGDRRVDRARELLSLLVLHSAGLPDREIAAMLWPEMAPQRGVHNLQMAAYLLRRLLGSKAAVRYAAGTYQLAPQLELWADARAFDAAMARSHSAVGEGALEPLESAVRLYRGRLLADAAWAWAEAPRLVYEHHFVAAALRLAGLLATTEPTRSDALAEQAIALEPENEAGYERLIDNAAARGDGTLARQAARRYRRAATSLGFAANPRLLRAAN